MLPPLFSKLLVHQLNLHFSLYKTSNEITFNLITHVLHKNILSFKIPKLLKKEVSSLYWSACTFHIVRDLHVELMAWEWGGVRTYIFFLDFLQSPPRSLMSMPKIFKYTVLKFCWLSICLTITRGQIIHKLQQPIWYSTRMGHGIPWYLPILVGRFLQFQWYPTVLWAKTLLSGFQKRHILSLLTHLEPEISMKNGLIPPDSLTCPSMLQQTWGFQQCRWLWALFLNHLIYIHHSKYVTCVFFTVSSSCIAKGAVEEPRKPTHAIHQS